MKRTTRRIRALAIFGAVAAVSACDDAAGPDALDDAVVLDMAVEAADATLEVVALWSQPLGFGPLLASGPQATPGHPGGHDGFSGDFSGTRSVTFFDAADPPNEMDSFDPLTTGSIHIVHEIAGTITRDNFIATIERARDMIVSGLEGEETHRTWNGVGNSSMSRSGVLEDGGARPHEMSATVEYDDVVVPIPGSDPRYPVSGTISRNMTATWTTPDGVRTRDVEMVITFDGTAIATAVVNGEVMEIDLSTREGRNPLRRRRRG